MVTKNTSAERKIGPLLGPNAATPPTVDAIRRRAYEKYCQRNGENGDALSDWLAAESELRGAANPCNDARTAKSESKTGIARIDDAPRLTRREIALLSPTEAGKNGDPVC